MAGRRQPSRRAAKVLAAALLLVAIVPAAGAEAGGMQAILALDREEFIFDPWPNFRWRPFRVRLTLVWTGASPVSLLRHHDAVGSRRDITAEVIGPGGRKVVPFEWSAAEPADAQGARWGSRPGHYTVLGKDDSYEIDLSTAFFDPSDPAKLKDGRLPMTPLGPVRYGLVVVGEYTIRVTVRHDYDGTDGAGKKLVKEPAWRGSVTSNPVKIKLAASTVRSGSAEHFLRKAAKGPKVNPKAATYFGSSGNEEFVAVGEQPDGTIVAFGNVWGPALPPTAVAPAVLGRGFWFDVTPYADGEPLEMYRGELRLAELAANYPNRAGVIVRYTGDLQKIVGVSRFDWGVANILSGVVSPADGTLIVTGQSTRFFREYARKAKVCKTIPVVKQEGMGPINYQGVWLTGDAYVAKLSADGRELLWAYVFEGHRGQTRIWHDNGGGVTLEIGGQEGLWHVSADGSRVEHLDVSSSTDRRKILGVNPADRSILRGGDYHQGTGREPWRRPFLYCYDKTGRMKWELYHWPGPLVGHDFYRLVSDSALRCAAFSPKGTLWISGWSDGGNSVFTRHPMDLTQGVPRDKFGMNLAGVQAGSFPHVVHLNPDTGEVYCYLLFTAYLKRRRDLGWFDGANGLSVTGITPLAGGAVAFVGGSASFLIQTPNAWYRRADVDWPEGIAGGHGSFVCVFDKHLEHPLFCSSTPGARFADMRETKQGILIAFRSEGVSHDNQFIPTVNAVQPRFGGGRYDGMLVLLGKPPDEPAAEPEAKQ